MLALLKQFKNPFLNLSNVASLRLILIHPVYRQRLPQVPRHLSEVDRWRCKPLWLGDLALALHRSVSTCIFALLKTSKELNYGLSGIWAMSDLKPFTDLHISHLRPNLGSHAKFKRSIDLIRYVGRIPPSLTSCFRSTEPLRFRRACDSLLNSLPGENQFDWVRTYHRRVAETFCHSVKI